MVVDTQPAATEQGILGVPVRRTATIMCTDVKGLLGIRQQLSEEALWRFLNEHYRIAGDVVIQHGGMIDKFMGDAMLALFNLPDPLPDHERQAVTAGLALRSEHAALCERWGLDAERHQVQVGINTGEVLAGVLGHPSRHSYTVIGDTVNSAVLLCGRRYGGFVLSQTTYEAARDLVEADAQRTDRGATVYVIRGPRVGLG